jgi:hypothetical protein
VELTARERLSLVREFVRMRELPGVRVHARALNCYQRYDELGMHVATPVGDWTAGLPDDVRAALRTIAAEYMRRGPRKAGAWDVVNRWIERAA